MSKARVQFGQYHHKGTSGTSVLRKGLHKRTLLADPANVVAVIGTKEKRRKVRLRKEPLDE